MTRPGRRIARACALLVPALLAACAGYETVETRRLTDRETLFVSAEISTSTAARTAANTREEGARAGAGAGLRLVGEAAGNELGLLVILLAPVVVPVTVAAGSAAGAASASSATREQIEAAIARVEARFRPATESRRLETLLVANLRDRSAEQDAAPCVTTLSDRAKCPRQGTRALTRFDAGFQLAPSRTGASAGALDFVGHVTISAEPATLLTPRCATWVVRRPAGDLFELAASRDQLLMRRFQAVVSTVAADLPGILYGTRHQPDGEGWTRTDCAPWQRALAASR